MKRNLFDIMQDFTPEEDLLTDECERWEIEKIRYMVYRKEGMEIMKRRLVKYTAAAFLTLLLAAGGAVGVDAASGGHVMKKVQKTLVGSEEKKKSAPEEKKQTTSDVEKELAQLIKQGEKITGRKNADGSMTFGDKNSEISVPDGKNTDVYRLKNGSYLIKNDSYLITEKGDDKAGLVVEIENE